MLAVAKKIVFNEVVATHRQEGLKRKPCMLGKPVKDLSLPSTGGATFKLSEHKGNKLVLYFYPKDNTPGCTTESVQFGEFHKQFAKAGCEIFGLSDAEEAACAQFGVIKMKNMYGKKVRGIERSTFVLDGKGVLVREWRGVKVPGHAEEVLSFVKTL